MRNALTNFLLMLLNWLGSRPAAVLSPTAPDESLDWTLDSQQALSRFLDTRPGRNFLGQLKTVERLNAINACKREDSLQSLFAAKAGGFAEAVDVIGRLAVPESISRASRVEDDDTTVATGEQLIREKFAP